MAISNKDGNAPQNAVRKLRIKKLRDGHPFLIYSKSLPSRHAYLEFPGGQIIVVTVKSGDQDFTTIRELSSEEINAVRTEFKLELITQ